MTNRQNTTAAPGPLAIHPEEKRWFAVHTRYKREKLVVRQLTQKGVEAYVPLQELTRYYTRKIKKVQLPLISGYIFVRINQAEYLRVLELTDVVAFIRFNHQLVAIPETEIKILRQIVGEEQEITVSQEKIGIGKETEIIGGRLTGLKGKVVQIQGKDNFVIELPALHYNLHLQVPRKYLKPLH